MKNAKYDSLRAQISYIRKEIEENPGKPKYLENVHGVGYRFNKPD